VLCIVDEDEMSESFDTFPFDPFPPFHVICAGFSSSFYGCGVLKNGTVAACELSLAFNESSYTETIVP
jgi:hypothetical protein